MTPDQTQDQGASPYGTGGGGVVLEHTYGASLLAALLVGDPVSGLGDEMAVVRVAMQVSRWSPVDDILVEGEARGGTGVRRRMSVAVRRSPTIGTSDESFVALVVDALRLMRMHVAEFDADTWRIGLAVVRNLSGADAIAELASLARSTPSVEIFRQLVAARRERSARVRGVLAAMDDVTKAAAILAQFEHSPDLTWRLLRALHVVVLRLEGDDAADKTALIRRLRDVAGEAAEADNLLGALERLAHRFAPQGAVIDGTTLRRALVGNVRVVASPSMAPAWRVFAGLRIQLAGRTRHALTSTSPTMSLTLKREAARTHLADAMLAAAKGGCGLVVTGQPDVGKSSLALAVADELGAHGQTVLALSLRDLPGTLSEFEHQLGADLASVLGATAVSPSRIIVLDGAEVVLEGRAPLMSAFVIAGQTAGVTVIAVARDVAAEAVADAYRLAGVAVTGHKIGALSEQEATEVAEAFPTLRRVAGDTRSRWLLTHPGKVDLLLRTGAVAALPDGGLSDADVFNAVWQRAVRRNEKVDAATPDGRERALLNLALRHLMPDPAGTAPEDARELPSLRADGLLLSVSQAAFRVDDDFASDLIRDLVLARLLFVRGFDTIADANAPRWAVRAARIACQAKLVVAGSAVETARAKLQLEFDSLGSRFGDRWADVPSEALLLLGSPGGAIDAAWPALAAGEGAGLARVLRLLDQRYTRAGVARDPVIVAPVVESICNHWTSLGELDRSVGDAVMSTVVSWFRGLAVRFEHDQPDLLRARVRDAMLRSGGSYLSETVLECLALLGPDLDDAAGSVLRAERPCDLRVCVDDILTASSLAQHHPALLLELADAYYIERPDPETPPWRIHSLDDGIRDHRSTGFDQPMAGRDHGPFWPLLKSKCGRSAIGFINRLLDHAARVRVNRNPIVTASDMELDGLSLDLWAQGTRRYVGDDHVWRWYRGSSVGPYPAMSALVAVERLADQLLALPGVQFQQVAELLLNDCHNLAMVGLVVGLGTRHPDKVGDSLDALYAEPQVWSLEFARAAAEGTIHIQGPDPHDVPGRDRRRLSLQETAMEVVGKAMLGNDTARLTQLASLADALEAHAVSLVVHASASRGAIEEVPAEVRAWASALRHECHEISDLGDGSAARIVKPPADVTRALDDARHRNDRVMCAFRLVHRYAMDGDAADISMLPSDIADARELLLNPPEGGPGLQAPAAVAAAALLAHATRRIAVLDEDLVWAALLLLKIATEIAQFQDHWSSVFPMGADRSAARGIPSLLMPAFDDGPEPPEDDTLDLLEQAMRALATCSTLEVRRTLARATHDLWHAPCSNGSPPRRCRHDLALAAFVEAARECRLGRCVDGTGPRIDRLDGNLGQALTGVPDTELMTDMLSAPIVAIGACASSACCTSAQATALLVPLLDAHCRGAAHWADENYRRPDDDRLGVATVLLREAGGGNRDALEHHVEVFCSHPAALKDLLEDLAQVATYDPALRQVMRSVWSTLVGIVVERFRPAGLEREKWIEESAVAAVIPQTRTRMNEPEWQTVVDRAQGAWLTVADVGPHIDRWLGLAQGNPCAVDAVVAFVRGLPLGEQLRLALPWLTRLVQGHFERVAAESHSLSRWLKQVADAGVLDDERRPAWQGLVDGLVAAGDRRAVAAQDASEDA